MTKPNGIAEWTPAEVNERSADCVLIDVRGADEYTGELSHIEGSKLVTLGPELGHYLRSSREALSDSVLVFVCRSGARSMRAAEEAQKLGYRQPVNLKGGMIAWNAAKLPVAKNRGHQ